MSTIELARFTVHPDQEQALVAERPAMLAALRERFPACLAGFLTKEEGGGWLDVIVWANPEAAAESAKVIASIPECAAWLAHIAEPGEMRHVQVAHGWAAEDLASLLGG
jgi:hypothetical protein